MEDQAQQPQWPKTGLGSQTRKCHARRACPCRSGQRTVFNVVAILGLPSAKSAVGQLVLLCLGCAQRGPVPAQARRRAWPSVYSICSVHCKAQRQSSAVDCPATPATRLTRYSTAGWHCSRTIFCRRLLFGTVLRPSQSPCCALAAQPAKQPLSAECRIPTWSAPPARACMYRFSTPRKVKKLRKLWQE